MSNQEQPKIEEKEVANVWNEKHPDQQIDLIKELGAEV